MEIIRKVNVSQHSKSRPNALAYKLSLSADMVNELGINKDDREVKVSLVEGKIIIEKVEN